MMCSRLVSTTRPIATLFMLRMVSRITAKASASTLAYLMRWPVLRLIWLNETFSVSDVAGYRATGQVTSERRRKPFQLARGAMGKLRQTQQAKGSEYHRGRRFQTRPGGESAN